MESFGARLKREREKKGVTLDDISVTTKIGTRMLRALEDEHFDQLPGGIFNKGFVRAYARHLGMDEEQAIADYLVASGETPAAPKPGAEPTEVRIREVKTEPSAEESAGLPWGILAIALLLVAFGFAAWGFYTREKHDENANSPEPAKQAVVAPVSTAAASTEAPSASNPSPAPADAKASAPPPESAPVTTSAVPDQTSTTSTPAVAKFRVLIKVKQDSWISIKADGKDILQTTLTAPTDKIVEAQKEIQIRAGSVGALEFFFNGRKLPGQGEAGEVKTLFFGADGLEVVKAEPKSASPEAPQ